MLIRSLAAVILTAVIVPSESEAGGKARRARRMACYQAQVAVAPTTQQPAWQVASPSPQVPTTPATPVTDASGFGVWLNAHRARYGVGPAVYDPSLDGDAATSNAAMRAMGFNHHWGHAPASKNVGMGAGVWEGWAASPAHNAWLLKASSYGYASDGTFSTFSAH